MPAFLHQAAPLRALMGDRLHPGGPELTRRGLDLAAAGPGDLILDAGCGPGGSLELLRAWGHTRVLGLDRDPALLATARQRAAGNLVAADLGGLPIVADSLDVVLCECAWNLSDRPASLREFQRVLRPGGRLIISDMYNRAASAARAAWPVTCCFSGAASQNDTLALVAGAGFEARHWEDHSTALRQLAGELILAHGSLDAFWQEVTGDAAQAQCACRAGWQSLPGLFLLIAEKV